MVVTLIIALVIVWLLGFLAVVYLDHSRMGEVPNYCDKCFWLELLKFFFIWPITLAICIYETHKGDLF